MYSSFLNLSSNSFGNFSAKAEYGKRRDIQTLRAIAVTGVFLFHAGFPVWNGFLGVDIFFCISGYLISSLLLRQGSINLRIFLAFILARAKRLVPAYLAVVCFTIVMTSLLTLPEISQATLTTALMGNLFAANIYLAGATSDYFGASANNNALLHTWTLSAEWQMYFIIAILYWVVSRHMEFFKRISVLLIILATGVSLFLWLLVEVGPKIDWGHLSRFVSYYGIGIRFWEFGIGAIASFYTTKIGRHTNLKLVNSVRVGSWSLLLIVLFYRTENLVIISTIAVAATLSILITGNCSEPKNIQHPLGRVIQLIGLCSYSIYLWHWPFIVLAKLLFPGIIWIAQTAALLSLIPSALSWRLIERDYRRHLSNKKYSNVKILSLILSTILLIQSCQYLISNFNANFRNTANVMVTGDIDPGNFQKLLALRYPSCDDSNIFENAIRYKAVLACQQSFTKRPIDVAILGDSHAQQLFLAMTLASPSTNFTYFTTESGLPILEDPQFDRIMGYLLKSESSKTIYLSARWEIRGVPVTKLINSLSLLAKDKKRIFLFDDLPTFPTDVSSCKYETKFTKRNICEVDSKYFFKVRESYLPLLKQVAADIPAISVVEFPFFVCDESLCKMSRNKKLIFRDSNHLTFYGADLLGEYILRRDTSLKEDLTKFRN